MSITQKRLKAYQETFTQKGWDAELVIHSTVSIDEACQLVKSKLVGKDKVDAIFCMSDEILVGAMKAIQQLDLRLPKDVGVIAISDGIIPTFYYPQITYIETSGFKLAKTAFSRMQACVAGDEDVQEIKIESIMVEGGSL